MGKLTYISLFSSAGVGCFGYKQEKFECVATNELLARRLEVQKINKKCKYDTGYIQGDILEQSTKDRIFGELEYWKMNCGLKDLTCIVATPPCQGMSVANHKKKDEQGRNSLVIESLKIIKMIKPKFLILENVRAFLTTICTDTDGVDKKIKEAILFNLGDIYEIEDEVLNFKNYGSNSSRTRTLVIGVRKDLGRSAKDLFPKFVAEQTLRTVIGYLPSLSTMGEISENDIYHSFRKYNPVMRKWIELLKEGENAFDNIEENRLPHYYREGKKKVTKRGNADKYRRQIWDKVAPCIHTRNDILASQNTIHPSDDRVFSVREVMLLMTVPEEFKWTKDTLDELNGLTLKQKEDFIKKNDINIRQSIGEAVPTAIFRQIAHKIKECIGGMNA